MIDETVEEIREMQTHSSSVVAVKAAAALRELLDRDYPTAEEYVRDLERNSNALQRANPSHATLHTTQKEILGAVSSLENTSLEEAQARTAEVIDRVIEEVETAKSRAAERGAAVFEDGTTVLTHDYSSTVLEALELAARDGNHLTVYVTEARPRYLGRKTARTLAGIDRIETHLITDAAAGHFLPEVDRVVVGMDCIVGDTFYNRVGTFPIAATAAEIGVPMTVIGSSAKLIEDGFAFENEFRSPSEVMREPAEGFSVENPAYDATPTRLLTEVVTDDGVKEF
ncbi:translation initiation factor eIF-2B [Natronomonas sp. EA1]|uniref:translation initiation factor eIF-2B n=1 Tax=Natronomonas sp. EA1 TaxID=3421655 RepID=UPI003EBA29D6